MTLVLVVYRVCASGTRVGAVHDCDAGCERGGATVCGVCGNAKPSSGTSPENPTTTVVKVEENEIPTASVTGTRPPTHAT